MSAENLTFPHAIRPILTPKDTFTITKLPMSFYESINLFRNFEEVHLDVNYQAAPSNWWVVISDVKGSMKAIHEGRYRDVNTVGAATIAAVQNAMGDELFPYTFGGDGATVLIPAEKKDAAVKELNALRRIARSTFQLELRIGMVEVAELEEEGLKVMVAKFSLNDELPLAMFKGGALTRAEEKIKQEDGRYLVPDLGAGKTDLERLSCRWRPLIPDNGHILSLLVEAIGPQASTVHTEFMRRLTQVFNGSLERANPVHIATVKYRALGKLWSHDRKFQRWGWMLFFRMFKSLIAFIIFVTPFRRRIGVFRRYIESLPKHSDYRKFDDMLRLVLDCSADQVQEIRELCDEYRADGKIQFGLHLAGEALMTCIVYGLGGGEHMHFIDGGDGGYAMAAEELKRQRKEK